ncbi:hypothetical protein [Streptomyces sp. NPDC020298]|uniref:hypothetical protein n=1 Tax=unclassified Streptomyces TaxID=2593676 RepID=UPI0033D08FF0
MTWPAALPGAAVRVLRTAAGRRALQLVLLVGGLFALGFVCGEQAHAAEGTPSVASVSAVSPVSPVSSVTSVTAEDVVRTVSAHVPRPVGDVVGTVTRGLDEVQAQAKAPSLPELPAPPKLPAPPAVEVPGPQQPGGPETASPSPASSSTGHVGTAARTDSRTEHRTERRTEPRTTVTAPQGPRVTLGIGTPVTRVHAGGPRTAERAGAPSRPAPTGDPDGALANRAAVGDGTSRHADAAAVTPDPRAPLRLAPGAIARVGAPGTRDRYRDIPVFPG